MADDSSSPATGVPSLQKPDPIPNPSLTPPPQQQQHSQPQVATPDPTKPPIFQPYPPSQIPNLPPPPQFRPGMQFNQAPSFQNPNLGVPPPGVNPPGSMPYPGQPPNPSVMRPFTPMANGYPGVHAVPPPASLIEFPEKRCKASNV